jgi:hypothetical protein
MDGLADTRVYKQVAMAKLSTKQNLNLFMVAMEVYERVEDDQDWWRSSLNPRTRPCWAPLDTRPIGPKLGDAAPWTEKGPYSKSTIVAASEKIWI